MAQERILIIEDDPTMLRALKDNFAHEGYAVTTASDGEKGLAAAFDSTPDLIVLDIMLPKINGFEICQRIRGESLDMQIIMLTAKGQESDIVLGLNLGADDYVTKPFSVRELLARAKTFLRRRQRPESQVYRFADLEMDLSSRTLTRGKRLISLTPKEWEVLALFAAKPGRAFTRDEILNRVWGYRVFVTTRSVDRCIATLRGKIESDPSSPRFIHTIREVGYRFDPCESD